MAGNVRGKFPRRGHFSPGKLIFHRGMSGGSAPGNISGDSLG